MNKYVVINDLLNTNYIMNYQELIKCIDSGDIKTPVDRIYQISKELKLQDNKLVEAK